MKPISSMPRKHYVHDLKVNHGPRSSKRFYWLGAVSFTWSIEARSPSHNVELVAHVAVVSPFGQE